mgnify:CR=1 FL=1
MLLAGQCLLERLLRCNARECDDGIAGIQQRVTVDGVDVVIGAYDRHEHAVRRQDQ